MSRKARTPKFSLHKGTGQARVIIDGKHIYLGAYGSPESKRMYRELVEQWRRRLDAREFPSLTLAQLALLYVEHCKSYYVTGGQETSQVAAVKAALPG